MADAPKRRPRRQFTDEFKASAVRLVLDEGKSVAAAARDLDLTETALRGWVKRTQADRTKGRTAFFNSLTHCSCGARGWRQRLGSVGFGERRGVLDALGEELTRSRS
jgi:hypothetical protein